MYWCRAWVTCKAVMETVMVENKVTGWQQGRWYELMARDVVTAVSQCRIRRIIKSTLSTVKIACFTLKRPCSPRNIFPSVSCSQILAYTYRSGKPSKTSSGIIDNHSWAMAHGSNTGRDNKSKLLYYHKQGCGSGSGCFCQPLPNRWVGYLLIK